MGFCLFNNVAIGARWARRHLGYERVMIVDWDVHHGNGTQHSFAREAEVLYCSVHQYPLYPGSGTLMETGEGNGQGFTLNVPLLSGHGDAEYARVTDTLFVPVGRLYRPDLVLVSCGFDCMAGDPVGSMRLTPAGIACLTRRLVQLAAEVCNGRLLLVLEGGYDLDNMRTGTLAALTELRGCPLAADYPVFLPPGAEQGLLRQAVPSEGIDQAITWARNWWNLP
jgi:acetoin utilization deacetylase AcuC-like enzyme